MRGGTRRRAPLSANAMPTPPKNERLYLRLDDDPLHGPEAGMPAGTLRAFPVAEPLRMHVAHILLYRETLPEGREVLERVLPDGAVRLVFNLGDAPSADESAGHAVEAIGASAAPALVRLRRKMEGLSVTLRPGAAAALLGRPASEVAGTAVHLDELWRGRGAELLERIALQPDDASRVSVLCAALQRRLADGDGAVHAAAMRAAQLIAMSGGRLHACVRALRLQREPAWASLALDGGFYDQSHLINEFQALCGLTPTEFLGRAVSGSSKTAD